MFRKVVVGVVRHGRKVFEGITKGNGKTGQNPQEFNKTEGFNQVPRPRVALTRIKDVHPRKGYLLQQLAKYTRKNLASELRGQFSKSVIYRDYNGLAKKLSMFAFVGVGFTTYGSKEEETQFTSICDQIKNLISAKAPTDDKAILEDFKIHGLSDYHLGPMIAKGCNSAVYPAKYKTDEENSDFSHSCTKLSNGDDNANKDDDSDICMDSEDESSDDDGDIEVIDEPSSAPTSFILLNSNESEAEISSYVHVPTCCDIESDIDIIDEDDTDMATDLLFSFFCAPPDEKESEAEDDTGQPPPLQDILTDDDFDQAIKMMFVYDVESNASALVRAMYKELVPAKTNISTEVLEQCENGHKIKVKNRLPPHPNIVDMKGAFVDDVPLLPGGKEHYPHALPHRLNPEGYGRNKTLFLVMKRYTMTLREFVESNPGLSVKQSLSLLTQLVEAVVHLTEHNIAHRDLKSDNIFIDLTDPDSPQLVISDFGECLCDGSLQIPYRYSDFSKGGNMALMAPEILCAEPSPESVLDYRKADLWTVGTLAYEIFGGHNPFYRHHNGQRLNSATYTEEELPLMPGPGIVQHLIRMMLARNPEQRPSPTFVASVLHVLLWAPDEWIPSTTNTRLQTDSRTPPNNTNVMRWLLNLTAQVLVEESVGITNINHILRKTFLGHLTFKEVTSAVEWLWA